MLAFVLLLPLLPPIPSSPTAQEEAAGAPAPAPTGEDEWEVSVDVYAFDPPDDDAFLTPIVRADRGALHLEARYNYEELDTGSVFVGRNFSFGDELTLDLTPMLGAVVGDLDGVAPGVELELAWKGFALYTESEYVFDFASDGEDFLYTWNELTFSPADWLRFGLIAQRTRLFDQELEVDRGLLLGFAFDRFRADLFFFNLDVDEPYMAASIGVGF